MQPSAGLHGIRLACSYLLNNCATCACTAQHHDGLFDTNRSSLQCARPRHWSCAVPEFCPLKCFGNVLLCRWESAGAATGIGCAKVKAQWVASTVRLYFDSQTTAQEVTHSFSLCAALSACPGTYVLNHRYTQRRCLACSLTGATANTV